MVDGGVLAVVVGAAEALALDFIVCPACFVGVVVSLERLGRRRRRCTAGGLERFAAVELVGIAV